MLIGMTLYYTESRPDELDAIVNPGLTFFHCVYKPKKENKIYSSARSSKTAMLYGIRSLHSNALNKRCVFLPEERSRSINDD